MPRTPHISCSPESEARNGSLRKKIGWLLTKISPTSSVFLFYIFLSVGCFFVFRRINAPTDGGTLMSPSSVKVANRTEFPLGCVSHNMTQTCPTNYPIMHEVESSVSQICPDYFRWIYEDLQPWKTNGITREMVEAAKNLAFFRLLVVDGRAYVEKYKNAYQTRDVFTIWGILQLLRLYPGKLPDLDLMFECDDKPVIKKNEYVGPKLTAAPPMFHYCGDDSSLDIVFPDWSFWGWPEINIKPWELQMRDLEETNRKMNWTERAPYAYWKGNLHMGRRKYLLNCNSTKKWNAQIYAQRWAVETRRGFRMSSLAEQCTHRYKIYMEGRAWSVSEKYIQACDSMLLPVKAQYYEFFTRSLVPMKHYWPINPNNLCSSIKFAVDWGNANPQKAQEIAKEGSKFMMEELKMKNVYDYMFHLLSEYGKLLKYKPTVPPGAVEVCLETMACTAQGRERQCKIDTMVKSPSETSPCSLPPPYVERDLKVFTDMKRNIERHVEQVEAKGNILEVS
ncbi:hypothetical protein Ancab_037844 [Ancistrocladus abbreviatus]